MSDHRSSNQQCKHWRYVDGGGRILKAEYAKPNDCTYCELEKANADFRELLLTNGRTAERNLSMSAEIERLRAALQKYGRHLDGCRTRDWTTGEKSWDASTCDCGLRAAAFSTETTQSSSGESTAAAKGVDPLEALGRQPDETTGEQK